MGMNRDYLRIVWFTPSANKLYQTFKCLDKKVTKYIYHQSLCLN
jgi:hypothetical protein